MSSPLPFSIVPCVLLALTLACGDSTDPGAAAGTYVLERIDQDPVPAVVFADETQAHYIVSDTIRFLGVDRGTISGETTSSSSSARRTRTAHRVPT